MKRNCIYRRGKRFQVKVTVPGYGRIVRSFPALELAERFARAIREGKVPDDPAEPVIAARRLARLGGPKVKNIYDLYNRVDQKRWSGNPNCKDPKGGSAANALRYVEWVGPKTPVRDALSEGMVKAFIDEREQLHGNSGATINRYTAAISTLAREALRLHLIVAKPEMVKRREGQVRMRIFSEMEEALILQTVHEWGYIDYADLFAFLADTGCRPGEAQKLTWQDFDGNKIHLEGAITKNSTPRTLTATPRVMSAIQRMREKYLSVYPGPFTWAEPKLSGTHKLWRALRDHFDWMGMDCVIYTYRHTCASRLVQRGIDLYRVQIWMGHKVPAMTQRYAKFAPDHLAELAAVLAR